MKKKTGIYNGICGRKWRLTCVVLIIVFSIISVSATGAENGIKSQPSSVKSQELYMDEGSGINTRAVELGQESDACLTNYTGNTESEAEYPGQVTGRNNSTESAGISSEQYMDKGNGTDTREIREGQEKSDSESSGCGKSTCKYCAAKKKKSDASLSEEAEKRVSGEKNPEKRTEKGKSSESLDEKVKDRKADEKTGKGSDVDKQKNIEDNSKTEACNIIDKQKCAVKVPEKSQGIDGDACCLEHEKINPKLKEKTKNEVNTQNATGKETKLEPEVLKGEKSLNSKAAETELKTKTEDSKENLKNTKAEQEPDKKINTEIPSGKNADKVSETEKELGSEPQDKEIEEQDPELIDDTDSKNGSVGSKEESPEQETGRNNNTESGENPESKPESGAGTEKELEAQKNENTAPEQETNGNNSTPESPEDTENKSKTDTENKKGIETPQSNNTTPEQEKGGNNSTGSHEDTENGLKPATGIEKGVEIPENNNTTREQEIEGNNSTESNEDLENKSKTNTGIEKGIIIPENNNTAREQETGGNNSSTDIEGKVEENTGTYNETYGPENLVEIPEQERDKTDNEGPKLQIRTWNKTEVEKSAGMKTGSDSGNKTEIKKDVGTQNKSDTGNKTEIKKNIGTQNKSDTENKTEIKKIIETKNESKAQVCNGTKNLKVAAVETKPKVETCNITKDLESKKLKPEVKIKTCSWIKCLKSQDVKPEVKVCNWTDGKENEVTVTRIEPEVNSWNNLKFILSYPYSLSSFYTVNESVKIGYKGSDALGQQNVYIYLIKERESTSSEETVLNTVNGSKVRLGDLLNNNTESYIQIPAVLNEGGDLSPLTLGPLPSGNYWVLITLAGNETENSEPEKEALLANYFEVLEYEMEANAPYTLEEGENIEVNLNLKNAPVEKGYTYWAMLIREDACTINEVTNSGWVATGNRPLVNGVDIIRNLEANLTGYGHEAGKEEIKSEIQSLIGDENGTVYIGEANESTLSLASLELPPGDYLLFTGAYESDKGLAGVAEKELRISTDSYGLGLKSGSGRDKFGDMPSTKVKSHSFTGISSILETPKAFVFDDASPYIQSKTLVEVVKHPPKVPSFLIGFAGTLLIGLAIMRRNK